MSLSIMLRHNSDDIYTDKYIRIKMLQTQVFDLDFNDI